MDLAQDSEGGSPVDHTSAAMALLRETDQSETPHHRVGDNFATNGAANGTTSLNAANPHGTIHQSIATVDSLLIDPTVFGGSPLHITQPSASMAIPAASDELHTISQRNEHTNGTANAHTCHRTTDSRSSVTLGAAACGHGRPVQRTDEGRTMNYPTYDNFTVDPSTAAGQERGAQQGTRNNPFLPGE